jgi:RNA-binding protein
MPLTTGQRRYLRGLAHPCKVIVRMGRQGAAEALLREIDAALDAHELIKIRLAADDRTERDRLLREVCASTRSELVQRVGNVGTLYRERRKDPAIRLPAV